MIGDSPGVHSFFETSFYFGRWIENSLDLPIDYCYNNITKCNKYYKQRCDHENERNPL